MLDKILSIEGLGIYRGKDSFASNIDLKKFNVIYGYNGAGKTSLSRAMRFLEKKETPDCLKEEDPDIKLAFIQDGVKASIDKNNVSTHSIAIRVFNSDFIWENIHWSKNGSKGIVTVSKEQQGLADSLVKKQKEHDDLYLEVNGGSVKDASGKLTKLKGKNIELDDAKKACDKLLTDCATKQIKPNLWCSDKSFNRAKFDAYMSKALTGGIGTLSEEDKEKLQKEASSQLELNELHIIDGLASVDDFTESLSSLVTQLKKAVSRNAIPALKNAASLEEWLKKGLKEHIHEDKNCPVCENTVSKERYAELKGHFNTEAETLENILNEAKNSLIEFRDSLPTAPIKETVHSAYFDENIWTEFQDVKEGMKAFLLEVFSLIENKTKDIENPATIPFSIKDKIALYSDFQKSVLKLNAKIADHNKYCSEQGAVRKASEQRLIQDIAVQNLEDYKSLQKSVSEVEKELKPLQEKLDSLPAEIRALKAQLTEIGKSVERINEFLKSYLGHDRLQLAVEEGGYSIIRNNKKSSAPLSEGEKTALAFCYFVASIQKDTNCDLKKTILVIDDPVSSLDSRHLNYVFNFMKKMTVDAVQFFILTHNFYFYKECQKRMGSNKDRDDGYVNLLAVQLKQDDDGYYSSLEIIPDSLRNHESEYHYFSSKLFNANDNGWKNPDLYGLANACRRVLECFFSFKLPKNAPLSNKFEELIGMMENEHKDADKMPKIVAAANERFVQISSHGDSLDKMLGLDNVTLDSVKDAVQFTLDFIEHADSVHFNALKHAAK